ncbi:MAG: hypothetical protein QOK21_903 [Solirubrobacteraceae bacterium]|jgi:hypothetical protein|nr:hypothetical protein [Solirubrobacteraceae bacterium]
MSRLPRSRRLAALVVAACVAAVGGYAVSRASLPATASSGFGGFGGRPAGAQLGAPPQAGGARFTPPRRP